MEQSIISSDSHVIEVPDLWEKGMPSGFKERAPKAYFDEKRDAWMFGSPEVPTQAVGGLFMAGQRPEQLESFRRAGFSVARPGGWDPIERMKDMVTDGISAEVLYPSLGLGLYCIEDVALQEALFRTYNDWVIDYCQKVPDRLYGIALMSMFDIDHAIAEMERCKKGGVVGTMIWQVPHAKFPFTSDHYERFWAASQDLDLPVHLHILTGFGASINRQTRHGINRYRIGVQQTREIEDARVSAASGNNQLRLVLVRQTLQLVIIDAFVFPSHVVRNDFVSLAREIQGMTVGQMAPVRQVQTHDGIARRTHCSIGRLIGL